MTLLHHLTAWLLLFAALPHAWASREWSETAYPRPSTDVARIDSLLPLRGLVGAAIELHIRGEYFTERYGSGSLQCRFEFEDGRDHFFVLARRVFGDFGESGDNGGDARAPPSPLPHGTLSCLSTAFNQTCGSSYVVCTAPAHVTLAGVAWISIANDMNVARTTHEEGGASSSGHAYRTTRVDATWSNLAYFTFLPRVDRAFAPVTGGLELQQGVVEVAHWLHLDGLGFAVLPRRALQCIAVNTRLRGLFLPNETFASAVARGTVNGGGEYWRAPATVIVPLDGSPPWISCQLPPLYESTDLLLGLCIDFQPTPSATECTVSTPCNDVVYVGELVAGLRHDFNLADNENDPNDRYFHIVPRVDAPNRAAVPLWLPVDLTIFGTGYARNAVQELVAMGEEEIRYGNVTLTWSGRTAHVGTNSSVEALEATLLAAFGQHIRVAKPNPQPLFGFRWVLWFADTAEWPTVPTIHAEVAHWDPQRSNAQGSMAPGQYGITFDVVVIGMTRCRFGAQVIPAVTILGSETMCTTPIGALRSDTVDPTEIWVSSDGGRHWSPSPVRIFAVPTIQHIFPSAGEITGGTEILVTGASFLHVPTLSCRFIDSLSGISVVTLATFVDSEHLSCVTPLRDAFGADASGVAVEVSNNGIHFTNSTRAQRRSGNTIDRQGAVSSGFQYVVRPELESVWPTMGPQSGGTLLTISGRFFESSRLLRCIFDYGIGEDRCMDGGAPSGTPRCEAIGTLTQQKERGNYPTYAEANYVSPSIVTCRTPPTRSAFASLLVIEVRVVNSFLPPIDTSRAFTTASSNRWKTFARFTYYPTANLSDVAIFGESNDASFPARSNVPVLLTGNDLMPRLPMSHGGEAVEFVQDNFGRLNKSVTAVDVAGFYGGVAVVWQDGSDGPIRGATLRGVRNDSVSTFPISEADVGGGSRCDGGDCDTSRFRAGNGASPRIATLLDGFVVVWQRLEIGNVWTDKIAPEQPGPTWTVWMRIFDEDAKAVTDAVPIAGVFNSSKTDAAVLTPPNPQVAPNRGGFVVAWHGAEDAVWVQPWTRSLGADRDHIWSYPYSFRRAGAVPPTFESADQHWVISNQTGNLSDITNVIPGGAVRHELDGGGFSLCATDVGVALAWAHPTSSFDGRAGAVLFSSPWIGDFNPFSRVLINATASSKASGVRIIGVRHGVVLAWRSGVDFELYVQIFGLDGRVRGAATRITEIVGAVPWIHFSLVHVESGMGVLWARNESVLMARFAVDAGDPLSDLIQLGEPQFANLNDSHYTLGAPLWPSRLPKLNAAPIAANVSLSHRGGIVAVWVSDDGHIAMQRYRDVRFRCRFGRSSVPATALTPHAVRCVSPGLPESSQNTLGLTVNGVDYTYTSRSVDSNATCPASPGSYCEWDASTREFKVWRCPEGHMCPFSGLAAPIACSPGYWQGTSGAEECELCHLGFECPGEGRFEMSPCPFGKVCDTPGLVRSFLPCPTGHFCQSGTATYKRDYCFRTFYTEPRIRDATFAYCYDWDWTRWENDWYLKGTLKIAGDKKGEQKPPFMQAHDVPIGPQWRRTPYFVGTASIVCPARGTHNTSCANGTRTLKTKKDLRDVLSRGVNVWVCPAPPYLHYCSFLKRGALPGTEMYSKIFGKHRINASKMTRPHIDWAQSKPGTERQWSRDKSLHLNQIGYRGEQTNRLLTLDRPYQGKTSFFGEVWLYREDPGEMNARRPLLCPKGVYCGTGMVTWASVECNDITMRLAEPAINCYNTPQPCRQGFVCTPGSTTPTGTSSCHTRHFCPIAKTADRILEDMLIRCDVEARILKDEYSRTCSNHTINADGGISFTTFQCNKEAICSGPPGRETCDQIKLGADCPCPRGHRCKGEGLSVPSECAPGSYQDEIKQETCKGCPVGYFCSGTKVVTPRLCDPGFICGIGNLSDPTQLCPAGYFCPGGTTKDNTACYTASPKSEVTCKDLTINDCDYAGAHGIVPADATDVERDAALAMMKVDLVALLRYYEAVEDFRMVVDRRVLRMESLIEPEDDFRRRIKLDDDLEEVMNLIRLAKTPIPCPQGYYCNAGTMTGIPKLARQNQSIIAPQLCLGGTYCPCKTDNPSALECGLGMYCLAGVSKPTPVPSGHFSSSSSARTPEPCTPGTFAAAMGQMACTKAPPGFFISYDAAGTCDVCGAGSACSERGLSSFAGLFCPSGHYCVEGTSTSCTSISPKSDILVSEQTVTVRARKESMYLTVSGCGKMDVDENSCDITSVLQRGAVIEVGGKIFTVTTNDSYGFNYTHIPLTTIYDGDEGNYSTVVMTPCDSCQLEHHCLTVLQEGKPDSDVVPVTLKQRPDLLFKERQVQQEAGVVFFDASFGGFDDVVEESPWVTRGTSDTAVVRVANGYQYGLDANAKLSRIFDTKVDLEHPWIIDMDRTPTGFPFVTNSKAGAVELVRVDLKEATHVVDVVVHMEVSDIPSSLMFDYLRVVFMNETTAMDIALDPSASMQRAFPLVDRVVEVQLITLECAPQHQLGGNWSLRLEDVFNVSDVENTRTPFIPWDAPAMVVQKAILSLTLGDGLSVVKDVFCGVSTLERGMHWTNVDEAYVACVKLHVQIVEASAWKRSWRVTFSGAFGNAPSLRAANGVNLRGEFQNSSKGVALAVETTTHGKHFAFNKARFTNSYEALKTAFVNGSDTLIDEVALNKQRNFPEVVNASVLSCLQDPTRTACLDSRSCYDPTMVRASTNVSENVATCSLFNAPHEAAVPGVYLNGDWFQRFNLHNTTAIAIFFDDTALPRSTNRTIKLYEVMLRSREQQYVAGATAMSFLATMNKTVQQGCCTGPIPCPEGSYCLGGQSTVEINYNQMSSEEAREMNYTTDVTENQPSTCNAGTYCEQQSSNSQGTDSCPAGYYCPSGVGVPKPCWKGHYCSGVGSQRPAKCTAGRYSPYGLFAPFDVMYRDRTYNTYTHIYEKKHGKRRCQEPNYCCVRTCRDCIPPRYPGGPLRDCTMESTLSVCEPLLLEHDDESVAKNYTTLARMIASGVGCLITFGDLVSTNYDWDSWPGSTYGSIEAPNSYPLTVPRQINRVSVGACNRGEILDCRGRCFAPEGCQVTLNGIQHENCTDWLENGWCDDGNSSLKSLHTPARVLTPEVQVLRAVAPHVHEVQELMLSTGVNSHRLNGSWSLLFPGEARRRDGSLIVQPLETRVMNWDVSATDLQIQLQNQSINVTVSRPKQIRPWGNATQRIWHVTFIGAAANVPQLRINKAALEVVTTKGLPTSLPVLTRVKTLQDANLIRGFWTLSFATERTLSLAWNASAKAVKLALERLDSLVSVNVRRTGPHNTRGECTWFVTFVPFQKAGDIPPLVAISHFSAAEGIDGIPNQAPPRVHVCHTGSRVAPCGGESTPGVYDKPELLKAELKHVLPDFNCPAFGFDRGMCGGQIGAVEEPKCSYVDWKEPAIHAYAKRMWVSSREECCMLCNAKSRCHASVYTHRTMLCTLHEKTTRQQRTIPGYYVVQVLSLTRIDSFTSGFFQVGFEESKTVLGRNRNSSTAWVDTFSFARQLKNALLSLDSVMILAHDVNVTRVSTMQESEASMWRITFYTEHLSLPHFTFNSSQLVSTATPRRRVKSIATITSGANSLDRMTTCVASNRTARAWGLGGRRKEFVQHLIHVGAHSICRESPQTCAAFRMDASNVFYNLSAHALNTVSDRILEMSLMPETDRDLAPAPLHTSVCAIMVALIHGGDNCTKGGGCEIASAQTLYTDAMQRLKVCGVVIVDDDDDPTATNQLGAAIGHANTGRSTRLFGNYTNEALETPFFAIALHPLYVFEANHRSDAHGLLDSSRLHAPFPREDVKTHNVTFEYFGDCAVYRTETLQNTTEVYAEEALQMIDTIRDDHVTKDELTAFFQKGGNISNFAEWFADLNVTGSLYIVNLNAEIEVLTASLEFEDDISIKAALQKEKMLLLKKLDFAMGIKSTIAAAFEIDNVTMTSVHAAAIVEAQKIFLLHVHIREEYEIELNEAPHIRAKVLKRLILNPSAEGLFFRRVIGEITVQRVYAHTGCVADVIDDDTQTPGIIRALQFPAASSQLRRDEPEKDYTMASTVELWVRVAKPFHESGGMIFHALSKEFGIALKVEHFNRTMLQQNAIPIGKATSEPLLRFTYMLQCRHTRRETGMDYNSTEAITIDLPEGWYRQTHGFEHITMVINASVVKCLEVECFITSPKTFWVETSLYHNSVLIGTRRLKPRHEGAFPCGQWGADARVVLGSRAFKEEPRFNHSWGRLAEPPTDLETGVKLQSFTGEISTLRIWQRTLKNDEIMQNYETMRLREPRILHLNDGSIAVGTDDRYAISGSSCVPCPDDHYCPTAGMPVAFPCPIGTQRTKSQSALSCVECLDGTFIRGLLEVTMDPRTGKMYDSTYKGSGCEPCPAGALCYFRNDTIIIEPCPMGYFCVEGTSPGTKTLNPCPAGVFCREWTKPPLDFGRNGHWVLRENGLKQFPCLGLKGRNEYAAVDFNSLTSVEALCLWIYVGDFETVGFVRGVEGRTLDLDGESITQILTIGYDENVDWLVGTDSKGEPVLNDFATTGMPLRGLALTSRNRLLFFFAQLEQGLFDWSICSVCVNVGQIERPGQTDGICDLSPGGFDYRWNFPYSHAWPTRINGTHPELGFDFKHDRDPDFVRTIKRCWGERKKKDWSRGSGNLTVNMAWYAGPFLPCPSGYACKRATTVTKSSRTYEPCPRGFYCEVGTPSPLPFANPLTRRGKLLEQRCRNTCVMQRNVSSQWLLDAHLLNKETIFEYASVPGVPQLLFDKTVWVQVTTNKTQYRNASHRAWRNSHTFSFVTSAATILANLTSGAPPGEYDVTAYDRASSTPAAAVNFTGPIITPQQPTAAPTLPTTAPTLGPTTFDATAPILDESGVHARISYISATQTLHFDYNGTEIIGRYTHEDGLLTWTRFDGEHWRGSKHGTVMVWKIIQGTVGIFDPPQDLTRFTLDRRKYVALQETQRQRNIADGAFGEQRGRCCFEPDVFASALEKELMDLRAFRRDLNFGSNILSVRYSSYERQFIFSCFTMAFIEQMKYYRFCGLDRLTFVGNSTKTHESGSPQQPTLLDDDEDGGGTYAPTTSGDGTLWNASVITPTPTLGPTFSPTFQPTPQPTIPIEWSNESSHASQLFVTKLLDSRYTPRGICCEAECIGAMPALYFDCGTHKAQETPSNSHACSSGSTTTTTAMFDHTNCTTEWTCYLDAQVAFTFANTRHFFKSIVGVETQNKMCPLLPNDLITIDNKIYSIASVQYNTNNQDTLYTRSFGFETDKRGTGCGSASSCLDLREPLSTAMQAVTYEFDVLKFGSAQMTLNPLNKAANGDSTWCEGECDPRMRKEGACDPVPCDLVGMSTFAESKRFGIPEGFGVKRTPWQGYRLVVDNRGRPKYEVVRNVPRIVVPPFASAMLSFDFRRLSMELEYMQHFIIQFFIVEYNSKTGDAIYRPYQLGSALLATSTKTSYRGDENSILDFVMWAASTPVTFAVTIQVLQGYYTQWRFVKHFENCATLRYRFPRTLEMGLGTYNAWIPNAEFKLSSKTRNKNTQLPSNLPRVGVGSPVTLMMGGILTYVPQPHATLVHDPYNAIWKSTDVYWQFYLKSKICHDWLTRRAENISSHMEDVPCSHAIAEYRYHPAMEDGIPFYMINGSAQVKAMTGDTRVYFFPGINERFVKMGRLPFVSNCHSFGSVLSFDMLFENKRCDLKHTSVPLNNILPNRDKVMSDFCDYETECLYEDFVGQPSEDVAYWFQLRSDLPLFFLQNKAAHWSVMKLHERSDILWANKRNVRTYGLVPVHSSVSDAFGTDWGSTIIPRNITFLVKYVQISPTEKRFITAEFLFSNYSSSAIALQDKSILYDFERRRFNLRVTLEPLDYFGALKFFALADSIWPYLMFYALHLVLFMAPACFWIPMQAVLNRTICRATAQKKRNRRLKQKKLYRTIFLAPCGCYKCPPKPRPLLSMCTLYWTHIVAPGLFASLTFTPVYLLLFVPDIITSPQTYSIMGLFQFRMLGPDFSFKIPPTINRMLLTGNILVDNCVDLMMAGGVPTALNCITESEIQSLTISRRGVGLTLIGLFCMIQGSIFVEEMVETTESRYLLRDPLRAAPLKKLINSVVEGGKNITTRNHDPKNWGPFHTIFLYVISIFATSFLVRMTNLRFLTTSEESWFPFMIAIKIFVLELGFRSWIVANTERWSVFATFRFAMYQAEAFLSLGVPNLTLFISINALLQIFNLIAVRLNGHSLGYIPRASKHCSHAEATTIKVATSSMQLVSLFNFVVLMIVATQLPAFYYDVRIYHIVYIVMLLIVMLFLHFGVHMYDALSPSAFCTIGTSDEVPSIPFFAASLPEAVGKAPLQSGEESGRMWPVTHQQFLSLHKRYRVLMATGPSWHFHTSCILTGFGLLITAVGLVSILEGGTVLDIFWFPMTAFTIAPLIALRAVLFAAMMVPSIIRKKLTEKREKKELLEHSKKEAAQSDGGGGDGGSRAAGGSAGGSAATKEGGGAGGGGEDDEPRRAKLEHTELCRFPSCMQKGERVHEGFCEDHRVINELTPLCDKPDIDAFVDAVFEWCNDFVDSHGARRPEAPIGHPRMSEHREQKKRAAKQ